MFKSIRSAVFGNDNSDDEREEAPALHEQSDDGKGTSRTLHQNEERDTDSPDSTDHFVDASSPTEPLAHSYEDSTMTESSALDAAAVAESAAASALDSPANVRSQSIRSTEPELEPEQETNPTTADTNADIHADANANAPVEQAAEETVDSTADDAKESEDKKSENENSLPAATADESETALKKGSRNGSKRNKADDGESPTKGSKVPSSEKPKRGDKNGENEKRVPPAAGKGKSKRERTEGKTDGNPTSTSESRSKKSGEKSTSSGSDSTPTKSDTKRKKDRADKDSTDTTNAGASKNRESPSKSGAARVVERAGLRVLLLADVKGNFSGLNTLVRQTKATHVVCSGNFGFLGKRRAAAQKGPNELEAFVKGQKKFSVPVYTVWGAHEDVEVVLKFRRGDLSIPNLFILDEQNSYSIGGIRLFGLGGAVQAAKLLDCGDGNTDTIAGEGGRMWTTLLQIGELLETSRVANPGESRVFVTHSSPFESPLMNILATELRADMVAFAQPHASHCSAFTRSSIQSFDTMAAEMEDCADEIKSIWKSVSEAVKSVCSADSFDLIHRAVKSVGIRPSEYQYKHTMQLAVTQGWHHRAVAILNVSQSGVAFETFNGTVDYPKLRAQERQRHNKKEGGVRGSKNSGSATARIEVAPVSKSWSSNPTISDVHAFFNNLKVKWVDLPRSASGKAMVDFSNDGDIASAVTKNNTELAGTLVRVSRVTSGGQEGGRGGGGGGSGRTGSGGRDGVHSNGSRQKSRTRSSGRQNSGNA